MLQYLKNLLTPLRSIFRYICAFPAYLTRRDKEFAQITRQVDALYQFAMLDKLQPDMAEKIQRLPDAVSNYITGADSEAMERNLRVARHLRWGKTEMLLDIAQTSMPLPIAQRLPLFVAALEQADLYSWELAAWQLARQLFVYGLDDGSLLRLLQEALDKEGGSDTQMERRRMLAMHIALLTIRKETAAAESLLERYLSAYGRASIQVFPPAAWLAYQCGVRGAELSEAAFVYENILKNRLEDSFREYLHGKSIALVANGPQELGRGRGKEIDAHDVVIRINQASVNAKYSADYGTKTTVWCSNPVMPKHRYGVFPSARYLLQLTNYDRWPANNALNRGLAKTIRQHDRKLIAPTRAEIQSLISDMEVDNGSTGVLAVAFLRKLSANFSVADVYGASFAEDGPDSFREVTPVHYCDEIPLTPDAYAVHSLALERMAFKRLFHLN